MASYFIFANLKNCQVEKITENSIKKDYFLKFFPEGKSVECTDTDFNDVKTTLKKCFLDENGNVVLKDNDEKFLFSQTFRDPITNEDLVLNFSLDSLQKKFKFHIDNQINAISNYLVNYPNDSVWKNYLNKLKSININNINFPIEKPFQAWFLEQEGVPNEGFLQLP
jgi:hypothetical protein